MANKPKKPQKEMPTVSQLQDNFLTPKYATDIIIPFIKKLKLDISELVWECCSGTEDLMGKHLRKNNIQTISTTLETGYNVLVCDVPMQVGIAISNIPYSIKRKIIYRFIELDLPFAFLIPADYSGWIIDVINNYGCEKIIPSKRIDYLTPNTVQRVVKGETFKYIVADGGNEPIIYKNKKIKKYDDLPQEIKDQYYETLVGYMDKYPNIYNIPNNLLAEYSTSQFHSMWLTRKFGLGKTETFVTLTKEIKENIL